MNHRVFTGKYDLSGSSSFHFHTTTTITTLSTSLSLFLSLSDNLIQLQKNFSIYIYIYICVYLNQKEGPLTSTESVYSKNVNVKHNKFDFKDSLTLLCIVSQSLHTKSLVMIGQRLN
ncbi:hypothetical protein TorRG33x02_332470, partial [Trema orientale]